MKKLLMVFVVFILVLISSGFTQVNALEKNPISLARNYLYENDQIVLFGNFEKLDKDKIDDYLDQSKFVLVYDFDFKNVSRKMNETEPGNLATAYFKKDGVNYRKTYTTNEKSIGQIKKDLYLFFLGFIDDINQELKESITTNSVSTSSDEKCNYVKVEVESGEHAYKPYGKIVFVTNVYMCEVDPEFNVYMVDTETEFIPGHALRNLGDSSYDNWDSEEARQKTKITEVTRIYYGYITKGEDPNVLEYWPKNEPVIRTISTSFGVGAELGVSQADGFSGTLTADFGYSQSYTDTDPTMSATTIKIGEEYGWYFNFSNWYDKTFHFQSGQMVEMENGSYKGQFNLEHDFWFQVDKFWGTNKYITYKPARTIYAY